MSQPEAVRLLEKVGNFDPVPCLLPDCGQPLHMVFTSDQLLVASFTEKDMRGMQDGDLTQWEVHCEAGHVILLPVDDAEENHLFGVCRYEEDDEHKHGADCAQGDFERLRRLVNGLVIS